MQMLWLNYSHPASKKKILSHCHFEIFFQFTSPILNTDCALPCTGYKQIAVNTIFLFTKIFASFFKNLHTERAVNRLIHKIDYVEVD